jgi:hypothetical protein
LFTFDDSAWLMGCFDTSLPVFVVGQAWAVCRVAFAAVLDVAIRKTHYGKVKLPHRAGALHCYAADLHSRPTRRVQTAHFQADLFQRAVCQKMKHQIHLLGTSLYSESILELLVEIRTASLRRASHQG